MGLFDYKMSEDDFVKQILFYVILLSYYINTFCELTNLKHVFVVQFFFNQTKKLKNH